MKKVKIETLKKGEFFRRVNGVAVIIYEGYCRTNKKYCGSHNDDISRWSYFKKGTIVETGFDF